ncbi:uncharacterized protein LOC135170396 [Diachasmimorpha longicaudata]|uniref:uncharacterized protein LOC135170396 n=1 Tax=Diachasmimorpha longicaudata TaxID=58733 RepID=UPI0030B88B42
MCVVSIGLKMCLTTILIISASLLTLKTDAAKILAIFPYPAHSHQLVNHLLTVGLAKRGHELTVFTTNPMNNNIPNYAEYSLNHLYPVMRTRMNYIKQGEKGFLNNFKSFYELTRIIADDVLSNSHMKEYISSNSTTKFDLIIIASFHFDSLYYLSDLLDAPLIVISSLPGFAAHYFEMGNPVLPASFPDVTLPHAGKMNFWLRITNLIHVIRQYYGYHYQSASLQDKVLKKHFGDSAPPIEDLKLRISLMLLNTHPLLHYPRPMTPNIVQIGGFRMGMMNTTLPRDLKNSLDNARQGFIYFSLGSNINSSQMRPDILERIIGAFSEMPYLIVWKYDGDSLPHKPSNVLTQKWIPQHGVLAHPNIKLFIYQGGLQSSEEAIECGVPLLGIPVFVDQHFNVEAWKQRGIAESLNLYTMTKDDIVAKAHQVISNPKYKENIKKLWTIFRDRPQHPLDEAIWWSEYVIRHKGAPYFQSIRLPWYQYHLIDIYIFVVSVFLVLFYFLWNLLQFVITKTRNQLSTILKKVSINSLTQKKVKNSCIYIFCAVLFSFFDLKNIRCVPNHKFKLIHDLLMSECIHHETENITTTTHLSYIILNISTFDNSCFVQIVQFGQFYCKSSPVPHWPSIGQRTTAMTMCPGSKMSSVMTFIVSLFLLTLNVDAARILAIFPWPAYSHQVINHQLSLALAKRGHDVTVFTANPMNITISNYTEHSLSHVYHIVRSNLNYVDKGKKGMKYHFKLFVKVTQMISETIYSTPELQNYLSPNSTKKFDLLMVASVYVDSLYYISQLLDIPLILTVTSPGFAFNYFESGIPTMPASYPDGLLGYSDDMTFRQRVDNLLYIVLQWYDYHYIAGPAHGEVLRKQFGDDVPSIDDIRRRIVMTFLCTHPYLHYARPITPNIVQIGGLRMGMMNNTLPEDLKTILDDAKQGFIYFSLGSNINSSELRPDILNNIIGAFSELPYLVLWKFESNLPEGHPKNVIVRKWIPQYGVLAHPNIKLFIYQGGLQSTEEAIECRVPLLGIPVILDQSFNINALKQKGVAESLDLYTMTKADFKDKIHRLISNPKYKKNMENLWNIFSDRPQHPLDEAVWWTEFVIRHKGAQYFQPSRLPWYRYHMIDIYASILLGLLIVCYLLQKSLRFTIARVRLHVGSIHKNNLSSSKWKKVKNS